MSLFRTLAHPKQQRWLGRHNDSHILPPADTVHNPCRDQSVITSRAHRSQYWHADFDLLVSHNGMGKDIWTVPAEDITRMLKVSRLSGDECAGTVLRAIDSSLSGTFVSWRVRSRPGRLV